MRYLIIILLLIPGAVVAQDVRDDMSWKQIIQKGGYFESQSGRIDTAQTEMDGHLADMMASVETLGLELDALRAENERLASQTVDCSSVDRFYYIAGIRKTNPQAATDYINYILE